MPMPLLWIVTTCVLLTCATVARAGEEPLTGADLLRCAQRAEFSHAQRQVAMRAFESYLTDVHAALEAAESTRPDRAAYQHASPRTSVDFSLRYVEYRMRRQRVLDEHAVLLWDQLRRIATPAQLIWIDLCAAADRAAQNLSALEDMGFGACNLEGRLLEFVTDRPTAQAMAGVLVSTAAERSRLSATIRRELTRENLDARRRAVERTPDLTDAEFWTAIQTELSASPSDALRHASRLDTLTVAALRAACAATPDPDRALQFWHAATIDLFPHQRGRVFTGLLRTLHRSDELPDSDRAILEALRDRYIAQMNETVRAVAERPRQRKDFYAEEWFAEFRTAHAALHEAIWEELARVAIDPDWYESIRGPEEPPHFGMPPYLNVTAPRVTAPLHAIAERIETLAPELSVILEAYREAIDTHFTRLLTEDQIESGASETEPLIRASLLPLEARVREAADALNSDVRDRIELLIASVDRQFAGGQRRLSAYARPPFVAICPDVTLDDRLRVAELIQLESALAAELRRDDVPATISLSYNALIATSLDRWIEEHAAGHGTTPEDMRRVIAETVQPGRVARFDAWRAELTTVINDAAAIDDPFTTLLLDARTRFDAAVEIVLHLERHSAVWIVGRGGAPQPGVGWDDIDRYERAVVEIEGVRALAELWRPAPAS